MKKYLIYLAVALTADLLAVVIFFRYIHISSASIAPGIYLLLTLVMTPAIAFANSKAGQSLDRIDNYRFRKTADGTSSLEISEEEEHRDKNRRAGNLFQYKIFVIFVPIYILFVLFFTNTVKIISMALLPVAMIACGFVSVYQERKEIEALLALQEKERREQEMREETGYWKRK